MLPACASGIAAVDTGPPLTDAELAMGWGRGSNQSSGDFSEQVVLRANLGDGGSVYAKLIVSNIANSDGRAQFYFQVKTEDAQRIEFKLRADRGDWTFATDRFRVELDGVVVEFGVGRASVTVKTDELNASFTITSDLMPLRPDGGRYDNGGLFYVTTIPVPRGQAELVMDVLDSELWDLSGDDDVPVEAPEDGRIELSGPGYVEHRWGNIPPYELAHASHNLLVIGDDETVVVSAMVRPISGLEVKGPASNAAPATGEILGWCFAANDDELMLYAPKLDVRPYRWTTDDMTSYRIPGLVYLSDPQQLVFKGVLDLGALSSRKDDLGGLSKLERIIVRRFMQPWTFRYEKARFLLRHQPSGRQGTEVRGEGTYMYQQIRK